MLACVGPAHFNREQTLNTLRYAARARNIRNKVSAAGSHGPWFHTGIHMQLARVLGVAKLCYWQFCLF